METLDSPSFTVFGEMPLQTEHHECSGQYLTFSTALVPILDCTFSTLPKVYLAIIAYMTNVFFSHIASQVLTHTDCRRQAVASFQCRAAMLRVVS